MTTKLTPYELHCALAAAQRQRDNKQQEANAAAEAFAARLRQVKKLEDFMEKVGAVYYEHVRLVDGYPVLDLPGGLYYVGRNPERDANAWWTCWHLNPPGSYPHFTYHATLLDALIAAGVAKEAANG